jgi:hypothetical protein
MICIVLLHFFNVNITYYLNIDYDMGILSSLPKSAEAIAFALSSLIILLSFMFVFPLT